MSLRLQTVGLQPKSQIRARQRWLLHAGDENNRRIMFAIGVKRTSRRCDDRLSTQERLVLFTAVPSDSSKILSDVEDNRR